MMDFDKILTGVCKHGTIYPLVKCELRITKHWEGSDMPVIEEEKGAKSDDSGDRILDNDTSPLRLESRPSNNTPNHITKQKSKTRSGTGNKTSDDSKIIGPKKETTFKVQVSKIEFGTCLQRTGKEMRSDHLRLKFDAEEGFTILGKPTDDPFVG